MKEASGYTARRSHSPKIGDSDRKQVAGVTLRTLRAVRNSEGPLTAKGLAASGVTA